MGKFSPSAEEIEFLAAGPEYSPVAAFELREAQELEIRRLREHVEAGRITEADYLLLVGTRVYGKPVADYAREKGLAYQAVKKRRQRVEAVIRGFEKKNQEIGNFMSPSSRKRGLYPTETDRVTRKEVRKDNDQQSGSEGLDPRSL